MTSNPLPTEAEFSASIWMILRVPQYVRSCLDWHIICFLDGTWYYWESLPETLRRALKGNRDTVLPNSLVGSGLEPEVLYLRDADNESVLADLLWSM